jgi:RsiW-degrading membrane proteinase PrsW (M82 family)
VITLISFFLAVAPTIFLVRYFYRLDKGKPEPKGLVLKVFLFGLLSALVAIPLELMVSSFQGLFDPGSLAVILFRSFIVAGLVEEWIKLTVVRLTAYRAGAFDEVMDGIVYTVVAGLGFACLENILYVVGRPLSIALIRAFTAVPLHALASGLMGYSVGKARFAANQAEEGAWMRRGLFTAVLVHGLYDFLLFMVPIWGHLPGLGLIPLILVGFLALRSRIRSAIAQDRRAGRTGTGEVAGPGAEGKGDEDEA